jgi:hypothetical protein
MSDGRRKSDPRMARHAVTHQRHPLFAAQRWAADRGVANQLLVRSFDVRVGVDVVRRLDAVEQRSIDEELGRERPCPGLVVMRVECEERGAVPSERPRSAFVAGVNMRSHLGDAKRCSEPVADASHRQPTDDERGGVHQLQIGMHRRGIGGVVALAERLALGQFLIREETRTRVVGRAE